MNDTGQGFVKLAFVASAAVILAWVPNAGFVAPPNDHPVKVEFASTYVSPDLAIHDTKSLLAFIGSDNSKTITIDVVGNAVTSVTG